MSTGRSVRNAWGTQGSHGKNLQTAEFVRLCPLRRRELIDTRLSEPTPPSVPRSLTATPPPVSRSLTAAPPPVSRSLTAAPTNRTSCRCSRRGENLSKPLCGANLHRRLRLGCPGYRPTGDVACDPKNRISCYTENNFNGDETIYKADTKSAPPGRNTCHSIDVDNGEWLVYTHDFYQGTTVLLKQDYYTDDASIRGNIRGNGTWDSESESSQRCVSQARSARPVRQHAITLFDKYFYCGATKTYRESNNDVQMQDCRSFIIRGMSIYFPK
ncbi:hypothetical protein Bbelb_152040 [Branchiostoma belcheri]|nr:hypothetical protein Bbelb_152040 [Branchiostoma belcheri]